MTDIHTHILPGMDDGARTVQESISMLRMEWEQGIKTVVLTPHFYSDRESIENFLFRRAQSFSDLTKGMKDLPDSERSSLPALCLGAEVAWRSELLEKEELPLLCIGQTKNMLVELPFRTWTEATVKQLYELMACFGITPIIAHLERYLGSQEPRIVRKLLELDIPIQISSVSMSSFFVRRKAMKLLRTGQNCIIATDCHNCTTRPPKIGAAMDILKRKLSKSQLEELVCCGNELIEA